MFNNFFLPSHLNLVSSFMAVLQFALVAKVAPGASFNLSLSVSKETRVVCGE